jgi:hypothetical protein
MAAGDDVDLCWRSLDRDWEIAFHPAALVWHHRRPGLRSYLRQQLGYGRSEALVEARHPDRFTPTGAARWRGRIYNSLAPSLTRQRVYRGVYGAAAYQSVYQGGGHLLDLLHQVGVPVAALLLAMAPLGLLSAWLVLPAGLAAVGLAGLTAVDAARATPPRDLRTGRLRFRFGVALHHLLQPLVRMWGRGRHRRPARKKLAATPPLPVATRLNHGVVLMEEDRPRADLASAVVNELRRTGVRAICASGWEDYDARLLCSTFVYGDLQTSGHPVGFVQARIRPRLRWRRMVAASAFTVAAWAVAPGLAVVMLVAVVGESARGAARTRLLLRRLRPRAIDP